MPKVEDPMELFEAWFQEAQTSELNDPDAMSLATSTPDGMPSLRMILLKGHGPDGFAFYTNKESKKGQQIAANARAALCFHWKSLRRQVRVEGVLTEVSEHQADTYFGSRSRESQVAAWASNQSRPMKDRDEFIEKFTSATTKFDGKDVPRPKHWSGFLLTPGMIEFWLDQPHRMHDRLVYKKEGAQWSAERVYP
ncbi:MAG: pyridoxamine 5'-phosphate oxidase [Rhodospirillaceae bacterium]|nr:pyridoxamine 5'-phosphate oxidase [Rhodospirillaceae bacterium]